MGKAHQGRIDTQIESLTIRRLHELGWTNEQIREQLADPDRRSNAAVQGLKPDYLEQAQANVRAASAKPETPTPQPKSIPKPAPIEPGLPAAIRREREAEWDAYEKAQAQAKYGGRQATSPAIPEAQPQAAPKPPHRLGPARREDADLIDMAIDELSGGIGLVAPSEKSRQRRLIRRGMRGAEQEMTDEQMEKQADTAKVRVIRPPADAGILSALAEPSRVAARHLPPSQRQIVEDAINRRMREQQTIDQDIAQIDGIAKVLKRHEVDPFEYEGASRDQIEASDLPAEVKQALHTHADLTERWRQSIIQSKRENLREALGRLAVEDMKKYLDMELFGDLLGDLDRDTVRRFKKAEIVEYITRGMIPDD